MAALLDRRVAGVGELGLQRIEHGLAGDPAILAHGLVEIGPGGGAEALHPGCVFGSGSIRASLRLQPVYSRRAFETISIRRICRLS